MSISYIFLMIFRERNKDAALYGVVHGFANALSYFQTAASFYVGAVLINSGTLDVLAVFRCVPSLMKSKHPKYLK